MRKPAREIPGGIGREFRWRVTKFLWTEGKTNLAWQPDDQSKAESKHPLFRDNSGWRRGGEVTVVSPLSMISSPIPPPRPTAVSKVRRIKSRETWETTLHIHEGVSKGYQDRRPRRESKRTVSRVFAVTLKRSITGEVVTQESMSFHDDTTPQPTYLYTCIATDSRYTHPFD